MVQHLRSLGCRKICPDHSIHCSLRNRRCHVVELHHLENIWNSQEYEPHNKLSNFKCVAYNVIIIIVIAAFCFRSAVLLITNKHLCQVGCWKYCGKCLPRALRGVSGTPPRCRTRRSAGVRRWSAAGDEGKRSWEQSSRRGRKCRWYRTHETLLPYLTEEENRQYDALSG